MNDTTTRPLMVLLSLASERCMPGGPSYFDLDVDASKLSARDGWTDGNGMRATAEAAFSALMVDRPRTGPKDDARRPTFTRDEARAEVARFQALGIPVRIPPSAKRVLDEVAS